MIRFVKTVWTIKNKFMKDEVTVYAAQASFFIIIAFFPFLMLLLTLVQVIPGVSKDDVLYVLTNLIPALLHNLVVTVVNDTYQNSPGTVISVTGILALYSASKGMLAIERGMNRIWDVRESQVFVLRHGLSVLYTIGFVLICMAALVLLVFGDVIQKFLIFAFPLLGKLTQPFISFRTLLSLSMFFIVFSGIYKVMPKRHAKLKHQLTGAAFATLGWILFSFGFSIYFQYFSNFSYLYGSLTAIVLLMLWLYICICIVFLGAEINEYFFQSRRDIKNAGR